MCDCEICTRNNDVRLEIERLPEDRQAFFFKLLDYLNGLEMDCNYYEAIIDGSWPQGDESLKSKRENK